MSSTQRLESINAIDAIDDTACIEDYSDKRQMALKSLIKRIDFSNIIELWKVWHINVNTISMNEDNLNDNCEEIEHKISKQQVYNECTALGQKLAALASEFNLTYIAATLRGLIQQIEQANSGSLNGPDSDTIQNPFLANSRGRHAKRIKSSTEIHALSS
ncbi:hypothetical protein C2G38_2161827 [Gigaspora rosea]|uniref:Uncharacterized protein n=1 Tax=Gigaspora rosea TaxID=44941 RepID=A0A397W6K6_9GLOM|nr:hypothetical protein C2G38_2161827 [Gigaspora rosea]